MQTQEMPPHQSLRRKGEEHNKPENQAQNIDMSHRVVEAHYLSLEANHLSVWASHRVVDAHYLPLRQITSPFMQVTSSLRHADPR